MPRQLSKEEMDSLWHFSEDGKVFWKEKHKQANAGDEAGCYNRDGYRVISYRGEQYKVHRLVYAYHTGEWPALIDHRNCDPSDNRLDNLRATTHLVNAHNVAKVSGASRFRGVSFLNGRPRSFIQIAGKRKFLGYFETEEAASEAYEKYRQQVLSGERKSM